MARSPIPVSTTFALPGNRIVECCGMVGGMVVRSPALLQGALGGLKMLIGGRIGACMARCEQTREQAFEEMESHAISLGAKAIIGMRHDGSSDETGSGGATEVHCDGTANPVDPLKR